MRLERVFLNDIEVRGARRPVSQPHVDALRASIREMGLRTPMTVTFLPDDDGEGEHTVLVAGAHRLQALMDLGEEAADCFVLDDANGLAELWEIDENFARAELTDAQRAEHHVRREAILVRRGEVRTNGGDRKSERQVVGLKSYASRAADDFGVDERTVQRDLRRGKNIDPELLAEIAGTDDDKGVVLDKLAAAPRENQRAVLAEIKEHQEAQKLTRTIDKTTGRGNAEVAAEIVAANLTVDQIDSLRAHLSHATLKDFLAALALLTSGTARAA